jgi:hypothetical protein
MKIVEFFKKYWFHDSLIEKVDSDGESNLVTLSISFCNWMQDDYKPDQPQIVDMNVIFHNVQHFVFEQSEIELDYDQILDVKIEEIQDDFWKVQFIIQGDDIVRIIFILSDNVEYSVSF